MGKPTIRILKPGDEAALEAFLLSRIESSMFLIGNMRESSLVDTGQPYTGTYVAAFEGERIIGVVAHYWNQNLVLQAPVHLNPLWQAAAEASQRPIAGLIGPNNQVNAAKAVLKVDESKIQLDSREKLYSLRLADLHVPNDLRSGRVMGRRIEARDLELIVEWRVAYSTEAVGDEESPHLWQTCRASVERSLKERRTWILEDSGEPVATSSFNTEIKEAVQIGGVWTPPNLRRRGYGRAVLAASLLEARHAGVEKAILFTEESNIAAQTAYSALGFEEIGDYRLTLLRSPAFR
ncbi:MAG: GNAT family N-acetyltransferase [Cyanobacteria bacterium P01_A01_bin.135]